MDRKIVEIDGVKYQVIKCPKCGADLKFKITNETRRVYGACKKCMHPFDVEIARE